jgi:hypothetical protein
MDKLLSLTAFLLTGIVLSGCVFDSNAASTTPEADFYEIHHGLYTESGTYTNKQSQVFVDQAGYSSELATYTSATPELIDFTNARVLLVDMGQRNTGGYAIAVTSVDVFNDYVTANVVLTKPGTNCMVTQALTNPYQFVVIPTTKEVLISESIVVNNC